MCLCRCWSITHWRNIRPVTECLSLPALAGWWVGAKWLPNLSSLRPPFCVLSTLSSPVPSLCTSNFRVFSSELTSRTEQYACTHSHCQINRKPRSRQAHLSPDHEKEMIKTPLNCGVSGGLYRSAAATERTVSAAEPTATKFVSSRVAQVVTDHTQTSTVSLVPSPQSPPLAPVLPFFAATSVSLIFSFAFTKYFC